MVKKLIFAFISLILLFSAISAVYFYKLISTPQVQSSISKPLDSEKLWNLVQTWRISNNLQPYTKDQNLCSIATDRADDGMDYHKGFLEKYSKYQYKIQENTIYNAQSEEDALDGWITSAPHLQTLQKPWQYSCIICHNGDCAQVFSDLLP